VPVPEPDDPGLAALGLHRGERVRFRRPGQGRWRPAVVVGVEKDGSLSLSDAKGARRAIRLEHVEVATTGPRGARSWEPVAERAARTEQLRLL
jgi:hypothetical protein